MRDKLRRIPGKTHYRVLTSLDIARCKIASCESPVSHSDMNADTECFVMAEPDNDVLSMLSGMSVRVSSDQ